MNIYKKDDIIKILQQGKFIQNVLNEDMDTVAQYEYKYKGKSYLISIEMLQD